MKSNATWFATSAVMLSMLAGHAAAQQPAGRVIPQGVEVAIAIDEALSSATSKPGDRFKLHLATPLVVDGVVLAESGAPGEGEVIHAARAGMSGKAGELIIAARFLEIEGVRVPLGRFRWSKIGEDNSRAAFATAVLVSPALSLVITGGNVTAPVGTRATAHVTAAVTLSAGPAPAISEGK